MRYIVHGAGSVGAVIGARLFEQGIDVVLIARGDHLRAIQRSRLIVQSPAGSVASRVPAVGHPSEIAFRSGDDVVLLATKTQDCARALDDLRHVAGTEIPSRRSASARSPGLHRLHRAPAAPGGANSEARESGFARAAAGRPTAAAYENPL